MRYKHYIIPIIYFLILWTIGAFVTSSHHSTIRGILDNAASNNEPVIVVQNYNPIFGFPLHGYSLDGTSIPVATDIAYFPQLFLFDQDGSLHMFNDKLLAGPPIHGIYRFPDNKPEEVEYIADPRGSSTSYLAPFILHTWEIVLSREKCVVINNLTNEERTIDFREEIPNLCEQDGELSPLNPADISTDWNVLVVCENPKCTFGLEKIWRYDIHQGSWSKICELDLSMWAAPSVSADGDVVAVIVENSKSGSYFNGDLVFLDSETGEKLHREIDTIAVQVGRRWACCLPSTGGFSGSSVVVLDMDNNFARTVINIGLTFSFALYEPPSNGLDGMYENYVPEDN